MLAYLRCWSARNLLDLYADGRLSPAQAVRVESHASACAACEKELQSMRGVGRLLRAGSRPAPPASLAESILRDLETGHEPRPVPWSPALSPAQAAALAYVALLVAAHASPGLPSQAYAGEETPRELMGGRP